MYDYDMGASYYPTNAGLEGLEEMLTFANAAASIITTKKGALKVMPTKADVEEFLANNR